MRRAGSKVTTYAKAGSLFGVGFGIYCAFRLRSMRMAYFNAFRATEKPVRVQFADGRTGMSFPDLFPLMQILLKLILLYRTYS